MDQNRLTSTVRASRVPVAVRRTFAAGAGAAMLSATPAHADRTAAGTIINNAATATYDTGSGSPTSVTSNTVSMRVDELLDVAVQSRDGGDVPVTPGSSDRVLAFTVTNAGNGDEAFRLTANRALGGDDFDPAAGSIAIDANGDGRYDPGVDQPYVPGGNDPVLAPDASATVFLLSTIDGALTDGRRGQAQLTATAVTGSGAPGTAFPGAGQGGGDALAGATTGSAAAAGYYRVTAAAVTLTKSAVVADPFGGTRAVPGATITYSIRADAVGSGAVAGLSIADAVPAGTSYRPGSITLDGAALTDAADGDAGGFAGGQVAVALGNVSGGASRLVQFKVRIDQ